MSVENVLGGLGRDWKYVGREGWGGMVAWPFPRPVYLLPLSSPDADKARDLMRGAKRLKVP